MKEPTPDFGERLLRRAIRLRPFYRRYPYLGPMAVSLIDMRGFYSPLDRVFYNRIPKSANSTVTAALVDRSEYRRPFGGRRPKDAFLRPLWMTRRHVADLATNTTCFTVVRNPYTRVLSSYRDKILGRRRQAPDFLQWTEVNRCDDSFLSFCRYLADGNLHRDAHWAPQSDLLCLPLDCFDHVLRVETLDDTLPPLLNMFFPNSNQAPIKRDGPRTDAMSVIETAYCSQSRALVTDLYDNDFSQFGYDRN